MPRSAKQNGPQVSKSFQETQHACENAGCFFKTPKYDCNRLNGSMSQHVFEHMLDYLSMYLESSATSTTTVSPVASAHSVELVLDMSKDEATASLTYSKLKQFLEDTLKLVGVKFDCAAVRPVSSYSSFTSPPSNSTNPDPCHARLQRVAASLKKAPVA